MKRTAKTGLLLVLFLLPGLLRAQAAAPAPAGKPVETATQFLDQFLKEDFQAASRDFDEQMKTAATPEKLAAERKRLQDLLGAYKGRVGAPRVEPQPKYVFVLFASEFEKATVDIRVVLDPAGKVAGFQTLPLAPPPVEYVPPGYVKKDAFQDRDVTVGSGDWALPGTLSVPAGAGPWPAVVLVHGSGPHDRDETLRAAKPFRDLAWGLASRGIAVLRYEKRTLQHAAKLPPTSAPDVQQETVDDALAAVDLLRRTAGIDAARIHVLGHSLGGMLIPRVGRRDAKIAGFIVLAGPARPLEDLIPEQIQYLSSVGGDISDEEKQLLDKIRADAAKIKTLKPGATETLLGKSASYWLDLQGYSPPEDAKALKQRLLILQGERDYQVRMTDFDAWKKALAGRPGITFKSYPKLNHLFIAGEGPSTPAEYGQPGHVADEVIADIAGWVLGR